MKLIGLVVASTNIRSRFFTVNIGYQGVTWHFTSPADPCANPLIFLQQCEFSHTGKGALCGEVAWFLPTGPGPPNAHFGRGILSRSAGRGAKSGFHHSATNRFTPLRLERFVPVNRRGPTLNGQRHRGAEFNIGCGHSYDPVSIVSSPFASS